MDGQKFIRVRGKVLGPYDLGKLQSLASRGQLSRLHEVSNDGATWSRASNFPEIFESMSIVAPVSPSGTERAAATSPTTPTETPSTNSSQAVGAAKWFYSTHGVAFGPLELPALQQLIMTGQVDPGDPVCSDTITSWTPAQQVPALFEACMRGPRRGEPGGESQKEHGQLPESLCKAAVGARPWMLFLGVMAFIYAGLSIIVGIAMMVQGARERVPPVVASGLWTVLTGVMICAVGLYIMSYCGRLASLAYSRRADVMENAFDVLRSLSIYLSVVVIVFLAFALFIIVVAVATVPGMTSF